jgi:putative oxidoreductase
MARARRESEASMPSLTTVGRVGIVWLPSLLLTVIFLMAGLPKLAGAEGHIRHFVTWGYPDWFRLVVGAVEVTSAVLLLVPRLAFFGALGIAVIMSGATYTHLIRVPEEAGRAPFTLTLLALALLVAYCRRPRQSRAAS